MTPIPLHILLKYDLFTLILIIIILAILFIYYMLFLQSYKHMFTNYVQKHCYKNIVATHCCNTVLQLQNIDITFLSGIAPPTLRREAAVLALSRKAQANEDHLLLRMLQERPTRSRLKSRRPFSQHAHHLGDLAPPGVTKQSWLRTRWKDDWLAAPPSRLHNFIRDPHSVPGLDLPRKQWTTLNRLRTGVGRFSSSRWPL